MTEACQEKSLNRSLLPGTDTFMRHLRAAEDADYDCPIDCFRGKGRLPVIVIAESSPSAVAAAHEGYLF
jgi:hypothetical protein